MPNNNQSDLELLQLILSNDEKAFNHLFERHWMRVYATAFKYVRDEELALEITHDIFMNIWNKRATLSITSFKTYVVTSASYHGIRKIQQKKAIPLSYIESYDQNEGVLADQEAFVYNTADEKMLSEDLDAKVTASLNGLPKRCKEIYLMSRKEHLTITEIAEQLNISKRTVENQLTVALKHLKSILKHNGTLLF